MKDICLLSRTAILALVTATTVACSSENPGGGDVDGTKDGVVKQPIAFGYAGSSIPGNVKLIWSPSGASWQSLCSGVMITNRWLLTAKHCVTDQVIGTAAPADVSLSDNTQSQNGVGAIVLHPSLDLALIRGTTAWNINGTFSGFKRAIFQGTRAQMSGFYNCVGYGDYTTSGPSGDLRNASLQIVSATGPAGFDFTLTKNVLGQIQMEGDSGGGCYDGSGQLVGISRSVDLDPTIYYPNNAYVVAAEGFRGWLANLIRPKRSDFDGTATTDYAVWRPGNGTWYVKDQPGMANWGISSDIMVPGDYNGDGISDYAVWRPSEGAWYVKNVGTTYNWGVNGDVPVPGDYDGDGVTDYAVWRPSNGTWYILNQPGLSGWGISGDVPVPADYDGDGRTDYAVWRPSNGTWYVYNQPGMANWGMQGDVPAPADVDGDGKADFVIFRPNEGRWYVPNNPGLVGFGTTGDVPVLDDYDGIGRASYAFWRPSDGTFHVNGKPVVQWGQSGDKPVPGLRFNP